MNIKAQDLTGKALNYAVALAANLFNEGGIGITPGRVNIHRGRLYDLTSPIGDYTSEHEEWEPSENWSQGGPIIAQEGITICKYAKSAMDKEPFWIGAYSIDFAPENSVWSQGPTALVAAMRCYVASKLGVSVDIPESLR